MKTSTWRLSPPQHTTTDKGHGRLEERRIWTSRDLVGFSEFPHLAQVCRIERTVSHLDGTPKRHEVSYGVSSLSPERASAARILELNRGHWAIENKLHWVRDVTFDEDRSQVRKGAAPQAMASLRNLVVSILRRAGANNIAEALRYCSRHVAQVLRLIGL